MDADISRRRFLGGAATTAALGSMTLGDGARAAAGADAAAGAAAASGGADAHWFSAPDPAVPRVGLRWAFSATVFFADRVMINSISSPSGRGYTSVGGGEIWGPRLTGRVLPHSGADYYKTTFSTYYLFEASDGALIFIHNRGTMRRFLNRYEPGKPLIPDPGNPGGGATGASPGSPAAAAGSAPAPARAGTAPAAPAAAGAASAQGTPPASTVWTRFRATPVFTAPKGPHEWMNRTVFVADAQRRSNPDHTVFTYYEVL